MKVNLKVITPDIEKTIVEIARVSSSRKNKSEEPEGLINYLIKNWHFSPFEHGFITMEIETSKAIGIQLLRHRSFTFQEFSQRYQDVTKVSDSDIFEDVEIRRQATNNRQSSEEVFDPLIRSALDREHAINADATYYPASEQIETFLEAAEDLYEELLRRDVAREQARMVLPMATKTKIFMTGSVRSWLGFLNIRLDHHSQSEIRDISNSIADILEEELPLISKACNNFNDRKGIFM